MESFRHITRHIEAMPDGAHIGALFDFDGTIIDGYSAFIFLREQLRKGWMKPRHVVDIAAAMANYSTGSLSFAELMTAGADMLSGRSEGQYRRFSQRVFEQHINAMIYPEALALIAAHRAKGHTIAIISSATDYQVGPAAKALGIDHVYTSHYAVEQDKLTGQMAGEPCWGEGKVAAAKALSQACKLDLDQSCFYSDSEDDLAALECVGLPRIVNASTKLTDIAIARGWPMQQFAKRGKPSLLETLSSVGVYAGLIGAYFGGRGVLKLHGNKDEARRFMVSMFTDIAFGLVGLKLNIRNIENYYESQPAVVIFNHQSQADGLIMMKLMRDNFAAIGKKELGRFKLFYDAYNFAGIIPIDRANSKDAIEAMTPLVDAITKEGRNVAIAPEGTRSPTKMPLPFKKGAFHVAMQAGAPIIPVVIHNAIDIQPKGQFAYRSGAVDIDILPPVDTTTWTKDSLDQHITDVRNMFLTTLGFDAEASARDSNTDQT